MEIYGLSGLQAAICPFPASIIPWNGLKPLIFLCFWFYQQTLFIIASILMGVLISVSSLFIEENDSERFLLKELLMLILYSILKNFGPRQMISLWRVSGLLYMLKKPGGWDKAVRKGFESKSAAEKGKP